MYLTYNTLFSVYLCLLCVNTINHNMFMLFWIINSFFRNEPTFDVSYKMFCERIIRQKLLINQEVLRMGQLRKTFIELVKSSEGLDASNYR